VTLSILAMIEGILDYVLLEMHLAMIKGILDYVL
jgi:hypothetical protein